MKQAKARNPPPGFPSCAATGWCWRGDHQQLPPTILSRKAEQEGFGYSLLEQIMKRDGDTVARRLDVQYRMNRQIMDFSSAEFY